MIAETSPPPTRFRALVLPHLDSAYRYARHLCGDPSVAEDIAQEALLKAFRGFASFRGDEPRAWLLAIVRNTHLDWARSNQKWRSVSVEADNVVAFDRLADETQPSAESALIAAGDAAALRAAVDALPGPFREALVLRSLEGLTYRQIAEATGAPLGTVMSRLARARDLLGARLAHVEAGSA